MKRFLKMLFLGALALPVNGWTAEATPSKVTWGAFLDTYFAYDFNNPPNFDRGFTTQPARSNEFNVNLAFIEAKLTDDKVRGRLALQAGTSVQSNYAGEPTIGAISGPVLSRHLQEAYGGYRLAENLWVDGGIYFSHVGMESFISRDNWAYTRALVSDYSPYYQTGVRFSYQPTDKWGFQLHLINGWQNISENNTAKSVGTQINYTPNSRLTLTYNTILGKETDFRQFHDVVVKYAITDAWQAGLQADLGYQTLNGENLAWYGAALIQKFTLTPMVSVTARVERYYDDHQIIVVTGTPNGFQTWGASANVDVQPDPRVLWRTEIRGYWSKDSIYPANNGSSTNDRVVVTSLGLSI